MARINEKSTCCSHTVYRVFIPYKRRKIVWFVLAGTGTGFTLYYMTTGRPVLLCAEAIVSFTRMNNCFTLRAALIPALKTIRFKRQLTVKPVCYTKRKLYTAVVMRHAPRQEAHCFK